MDSIHLRVLSFAHENPEGITLAQLEENFPDDFKWIEREIDNKNLFIHGDIGPWHGGKLYLTFQDRFRLLEHEELKNANKSSQVATYFATAALIVSIIATSLSVYFSVMQRNSKAVLNEAQFEQLLTLKNEEISAQISELIEKQEETTKAVKTSQSVPLPTPNKASNATP